MTSSDIIELVAYLDGEVSHEERIAIEGRLADDANYREVLLELQASWQLLDQLGRADAHGSFTKTTIAIVTSDLQADPAQPAWKKPFLLAACQRWGLQFAALALAATVGFTAIYLPLRRQHQRELLDLPVAHNLDFYRYADSIEFLRLLDESEIFAEEADDVL